MPLSRVHRPEYTTTQNELAQSIPIIDNTLKKYLQNFFNWRESEWIKMGFTPDGYPLKM
jgi:hypothetical protein